MVSKVLGKVFEKTPFPEGIARRIVRVSKYVVYVVGLFVVVGVLGVDLTSVLLGLGAFSIAISFATSNIIQNLVSGLIVLGEKAFEVGDVIEVRVGGKEYRGRVVKIGIRCAVIRTEDGDTVFVPNSVFCLYTGGEDRRQICKRKIKEHQKREKDLLVFWVLFRRLTLSN